MEGWSQGKACGVLDPGQVPVPAGASAGPPPPRCNPTPGPSTWYGTGNEAAFCHQKINKQNLMLRNQINRC